MKKILLILIANIILPQLATSQINKNALENKINAALRQHALQQQREQQKKQDEARRNLQFQAKTQSDILQTQQQASELSQNYQVSDYLSNPTTNESYRPFTNQNDKQHKQELIDELENANNKDNKERDYKEKQTDLANKPNTSQWGKIDNSQRGESVMEKLKKDADRFSDETEKKWQKQFGKDECKYRPNQCIGHSRPLPNKTPYPQNNSQQNVNREPVQSEYKTTKPKRVMANDKQGQHQQQGTPRKNQDIKLRKKMTQAQVNDNYTSNERPAITSTEQQRKTSKPQFIAPSQQPKQGNNQQGKKLSDNVKSQNQSLGNRQSQNIGKNKGKTQAATANNRINQNTPTNNNVTNQKQNIVQASIPKNSTNAQNNTKAKSRDTNTSNSSTKNNNSTIVVKQNAFPIVKTSKKNISGSSMKPFVENKKKWQNDGFYNDIMKNNAKVQMQINGFVK